MLAKPHIREELRVGAAALHRATGLRAGRVVSGLGNVALADPLDLFEEDSEGELVLRKLKDVPYKTRIAIAGIKAKVISLKTLEGVSEKVEIVEIKLNDRVSALDKLMKHFGEYDEDNKQKVPTTQAEIDALKERLRSRGVDLDKVTHRSAN